MSKEVRTLVMTPAFIKDVDPAYIGEAIKRLIDGIEEPFGVVLIGTREETTQFAELNLWHFAPPTEAR